MPAAPVYQDLENTLKTAHLIAPLFIWSIIGTLCCLPVLPRVWATRIFTLRFHVGAILFICVQAIINAWIWSGHARYIPILTQMSVWVNFVVIGALRLNYVCIFKFLWICSKPSGTLYIYDKRDRINLTDRLIVGAGIVCSVIFCVLGGASILVFENLGPSLNSAGSLSHELLQFIPLMCIPALVSSGYGGLALFNLWRFRHSTEWTRLPRADEQSSHPHFRTLTPYQLLKRSSAILIFLVVILVSPLAMASTLVWLLTESPEYFRSLSFSEVLKNQRVVYGWSQDGLHAYRQIPANIRLPDRTFFMTANTFLPLPALHLFVFWGTGRQSRAMYSQWARHLSAVLHLSQLRDAIKLRLNQRQTNGENNIVPFGTDPIPLGTVASSNTRAELRGRPSAINPFHNPILPPLPTALPPAAPSDASRPQSKRPLLFQLSPERYFSTRKHPIPPVAVTDISLTPTPTSSSSGEAHKSPLPQSSSNAQTPQSSAQESSVTWSWQDSSITLVSDSETRGQHSSKGKPLKLADESRPAKGS